MGGGRKRREREREHSAEEIQCEILFHFTFSYKLLADSFRCKCNVYLTGPRCIISHPCETPSRRSRDFLPTRMPSTGSLFVVLVEFSRRIVSKEGDVETRRSTWHPFWHTTQLASLFRKGKYASLETRPSPWEIPEANNRGSVVKIRLNQECFVYTINWKVFWWTRGLDNWLWQYCEI